LIQLLRQAHGLMTAHVNNEPFNVEFLIEPNKVGRVVGPKGATIHNLKSKSQLSQLRVSKEPQVSSS